MTGFGFDMPKFCSLNELLSEKDVSVNAILPWGWSPAAHFILKDLKVKCSPEFQSSPVFYWHEEHKKLFERMTSLDFLNYFLKQNPFDFFISQEMIGAKVSSIEEIGNLLKRFDRLVLKSPVSSSGRGIQIIRKSALNASNRQWISGILNQQKYLIAEPFLNKIADISFQFRITGNCEPEYLGYSVFETNSNGQYKGTFIHPEIEPAGISEIIHEVEIMIGITAIKLGEALKDSVYNVLHRGFLGIDAMIYRDKKGLKIQPCIEINSRMNMGILTKFIEKKINRDTTGKYELFYGSRGEFHQFAKEMALEHPLKIRNGKLSSGFLSLVEPDMGKKFGAYIILGTGS